MLLSLLKLRCSYLSTCSLLSSLSGHSMSFFTLSSGIPESMSQNKYLISSIVSIIFVTEIEASNWRFPDVSLECFYPNAEVVVHVLLELFDTCSGELSLEDKMIPKVDIL